MERKYLNIRGRNLSLEIVIDKSNWAKNKEFFFLSNKTSKDVMKSKKLIFIFSQFWSYSKTLSMYVGIHYQQMENGMKKRKTCLKAAIFDELVAIQTKNHQSHIQEFRKETTLWNDCWFWMVTLWICSAAISEYSLKIY